MPFIDDHGRLFGKWNVIDVALLVLLLFVIPVAYGAYVLFKKPAPVITALEPKDVPQNQPATIKVTGEHFRAFLRARVGTTDMTLLIDSPTNAELKLPASMAVGTYDLVLYDEARELFRMPQALTVSGPPPPPPGPTVEMQAVGRFVSVAPADVPTIAVGAKFIDRPRATNEAPVDVLAVGASEPMTQRLRTSTSTQFAIPTVTNTVTVPAILHIKCVVGGDQCKLGDAPLMQNSTIPLVRHVSGGGPPSPAYSFAIELLRAPDTAPTFPAAQQIDVQAVGAFVSIGNALAKRIRPGLTIAVPNTAPTVDGNVGSVIAVRPPETGTRRITISDRNVIDTTAPGTLQVPAILRLHCIVLSDQCTLGVGGIVARGLTISFKGQGAAPMPLEFRIDDLRPARSPVVFPSDTTSVLVRARLLVASEMVNLLHEGDVDRFALATLQSLGPKGATLKGTTLYGSLQTPTDLIPVDCTFRVPAALTNGVWQYAGRPVRAGEIFAFETDRYSVNGPIVDVQFPNTVQATH